MPHATGNEPTIVVIDNNQVTRLVCEQILARDGFRVAACESGARALEVVAASEPVLVLLDLNMPDVSGLDLLPRLRALDRDLPIVVITGYPTVEHAVASMKGGAADFLPKPFSATELRAVVYANLPRSPAAAPAPSRS